MDYGSQTCQQRGGDTVSRINSVEDEVENMEIF